MTYASVRLKLEGDGLASSSELQARDKLARQIENQQLGKVVCGGSGLGEMDIGVELAGVTIGSGAIRKLAHEFGLEIVDIEIDSE